MSDVQTTETTAPEHNPARGRLERKFATRQRRRQRNAGSLNRMAQFKLDVFDPSQLDLANYVYRWVNEGGSRIREATKVDDYEFVHASDLKGFDTDLTDSESDEQVRMIVGQHPNGEPIYSYLVAKPRDWFEEDMEAMVDARQDMMEGVVKRTDLEEIDDSEDGEKTAALREGGAYVPRDVEMGSPTARRRKGPITRGSLVAKPLKN